MLIMKIYRHIIINFEIKMCNNLLLDKTTIKVLLKLKFNIAYFEKKWIDLGLEFIREKQNNNAQKPGKKYRSRRFADFLIYSNTSRYNVIHTLMGKKNQSLKYFTITLEKESSSAYSTYIYIYETWRSSEKTHQINF